MNTPIISIIVPVYNAEAYLDQCVQSILNQTYKDFELLLVDDGSLDRCPAMCDEWAQKDARVRVIHKSNSGVSDTRNVGLDAAVGQYLSFVDSDDFIHPQMYEILWNVMQQGTSDIVTCKYLSIQVGEKVEFPQYSYPVDVMTVDRDTALSHFYDRYHDVIWVSVWGKLYKRSVFETIRFRKGIIFEDQDLFPYIVDSANQIAVLDYPLYYYIFSPDSITRSGFSDKYIETLEITGRHIAFFVSRGHVDQANLAAGYFISSVILTYQEIFQNHPEMKHLFWKKIRDIYSENVEIIRNSCSVSRTRRLILFLFPRFPKIAVWLYQIITR